MPSPSPRRRRGGGGPQRRYSTSAISSYAQSPIQQHHRSFVDPTQATPAKSNHAPASSSRSSSVLRTSPGRAESLLNDNIDRVFYPQSSPVDEESYDDGLDGGPEDIPQTAPLFERRRSGRPAPPNSRPLDLSSFPLVFPRGTPAEGGLDRAATATPTAEEIKKTYASLPSSPTVPRHSPTSPDLPPLPTSSALDYQSPNPTDGSAFDHVSVKKEEPDDNEPILFPTITNSADLDDRPKGRDPSSDTHHVKLPPFSLWDYLREELLSTDLDSHQELKWERVSNFLRVPLALERVRSLRLFLPFS